MRKRATVTRLRTRSLTILLVAHVGVVGCAPGEPDGGDVDDAPSAIATAAPTLPPSEEGAVAALNGSPRHGEWVDVPLPGGDTPIRTWAVYPERSDDAPVVIVIMEIYGLTDWIRSVADQLAADGFIALAPDLLSGMGPGGGGTESHASRDDVVATVRSLERPEAMRRLDAVRQYALEIPSATDEVGVVGYCWGGGTSFAYAIHQPELNAAVVYYGSSPSDTDAYAGISAPVLGLYGGDDQRVNATIPAATEAMQALGKSYEVEIYEGAGHGFLRAQADRDGANMRATEQGWARTVAFFREQMSGA